MSFDKLHVLLSDYIRKDDKIKSVIGRASESTNSAYFIIETADYSYLELSLSDHDGGKHDQDLMDVFDDDDDDCLDEDVFDDIARELSEATGIDIDMLADSENFGVNRILRYDLDPKRLIGKFIASKAFVDDACKVADAKLIKDDHLLKVDYVSLDGKSTDTEIYCNYIPRTASDIDIATINYLTDHESIHEARRMFYTDDGYAFLLTPFDEYDGNEMDGEEYDFNGKKYVAEYLLLEEAENN